jgi:23S rRNA pseudouridine1911/1915/1917 synthase
MKILFEDEAVLVIHKPAGVVVNRAESINEPTVQDWADEYLRYPGVKGEIQDHVYVFTQRSGLAHRLDRETSGALLIAKTPDGLVELMRQFKAREVEKTYIALCHGKLEPSLGWFHAPIARKGVRIRKFGVDPEGKPAYTGYAVDSYYCLIDRVYTLVQLFPKTGRTHQIRVHLSHYHHPLVSDRLYAPEKQYRQDIVWCPRHFLHAQELSFSHPVSGKRITVVSPLAADLKQALDTLEPIR